MHRIVVKRLRFSNILSYGNNVNEVTFTDGLTWISGPNGAGKSTIMEALTFVFFNSPYRDITKPQLKNTANKSKMFVEVEFDRIDNLTTDSYVISRYMEKSGSTSTTIMKNNIPEKKGAGTSQKKLEDEILGFNKTLWENVISLNTIQTVPFIDMEPKDKRSLLESVLTLCIDKWKDLNKTAFKEATTKFESASSDCIKYNRDLAEFDVIIEKMQQEKANDIEDLKTEVSHLTNELNSKYFDLSGVVSEYNKIVDMGKSEKAKLTAIGDVDSQLVKYMGVVSLIPSLETDKLELIKCRNNFNSIESEFKLMQSKVSEIDGVSIKSRLQIITSELLKNGRTLSSLQTEVKLLERGMNDITTKAKSVISGVPCHACGKLSTEADAENIKSSYRKEFKEKLSESNRLGKDIVIVQEKISALEVEQAEISIKVTEYDRLINELNKYENTEYNTAKNALNNIERNIKLKESQIEAIGETDITKLNSIIEDLQNKKQIKISIEKILSDLRSDASTQVERKNGLESTINTLKFQIERKQAKIDEKLNIDLDDALTSTSKKRDGVIDDLNTAKTRVIKYSDEIEITKYIDKLCSDNGMKKIVLGIFVPNLNRAIMDNMKAFDLPFIIEFDDSMNYKFSSRYGLSEVYNGLSEGQKRKINFAIAMAFRDFVTSIGDFKINVLFLDEVLDVSTDSEALRDMIMLLKNKVTEIGGIYLITHRGNDVTECFDHRIEVEYDGRYSSLSAQDLSSSKTKY